jgi:fused signal recognition particle receptor
VLRKQGIDCIRLQPSSLPAPLTATTPDPMFSFFKRKPKDTPPVPADAPAAPAEPPAQPAAVEALPVIEPAVNESTVAEPEVVEPAQTSAETRQSWMKRLKAGLSKTSSSLTTLFVGARIDEDLYEELESALLMSDAGMDATQYLLDNLRRKVKEEKLLDAAAVKAAL